MPSSVGDLLGELGVGPAAEDHQVLLGGPLHSGHACGSSCGRRVGCGAQDSALTGAARPNSAVARRTSRVHDARPRRPRPARCPGRLRLRPSPRCCAAARCDTASAPGGTSRRTTVPAAGAGAVADRRPGRRRCCWTPVRACRPIDGAVLRDPVVVGEDRAGADVGALADLGVADVGQVRHLGAVADLRRSWSRRRRRSCRRRRARCRAAGRRTGRRWPRRRSRRARRGCVRRGRRRRPRSP